MTFDFQLFNWIASVFKSKDPALVEEYIPMQSTMSDEEVLKTLASQCGLPLDPIQKLIDYRNKHFAMSKPRYWAVSNFRIHSKNKRLFVFDTYLRVVQTYFVAHGKGSDPDFSGFCEKFSNTPGSLCSSEGIYRCAETYISSKFGYALRLDGLEATNSNVRKRAIVFHGAKYAEDSYVKSNGKTGRSEGCQAVGFQYSKDLIDKLKNGSLLIVWKD